MTVSIRLLLALALATLAGCATAPAPEAAPGESSETEPTIPPEPGAKTQPDAAPPTRPSSEGATLALLNQSERAAESGAIDEALSYAERAVRIDPRRADLWTRLAQLELQNEDPTTAIRYAQKALSLAANRPDWERDAWLVIADAKEAMGEADEAADIRERWQTARG